MDIHNTAVHIPIRQHRVRHIRHFLHSSKPVKGDLSVDTVAGTTASALTGSKNRRMPAGKAINATSTMVAAMCAMLILAVTQTSAKIDGADVSVFFTDNMGTKGLLSSFVAAFATVNIYAFCIKRDITIKLPKEVPGAIAQNFRDIFAFSFSADSFTLPFAFSAVSLPDALEAVCSPLLAVASAFSAVVSVAPVSTGFSVATFSASSFSAALVTFSSLAFSKSIFAAA